MRVCVCLHSEKKTADNMASALVEAVEKLDPLNRKRFFAQLADEFEQDMVKVMRHLQKCEACGNLVNKVIKCDARKGKIEQCCQACATLCVCGTRFAPSGESRHDECRSTFVRCFCGKRSYRNFGHTGDTCPSQGCFRTVEVRLEHPKPISVSKSDYLDAVLSKWEMRRTEVDTWVATKPYRAAAIAKVGDLAQAYPNSILAGLHQGVFEDFIEYTYCLHYVRGDESDSEEGEDVDSDGGLEAPEPEHAIVTQSVCLVVTANLLG